MKVCAKESTGSTVVKAIPEGTYGNALVFRFVYADGTERVLAIDASDHDDGNVHRKIKLERAYEIYTNGGIRQVDDLASFKTTAKRPTVVALDLPGLVW